MSDDIENKEIEEDGCKYLTFMIGDVSYGLDLGTVTEIIGLQNITPVPDVPDCVRGVINLRGKVIPVMDVRSRFNLEPQAYHDRTCIIVIEVEGSSVGLVVDAVSEVLSVADEDIEPPPAVGLGLESRCISGLGKVGDEVKLILDAGILIEVDGRAQQSAPEAAVAEA